MISLRQLSFDGIIFHEQKPEAIDFVHVASMTMPRKPNFQLLLISTFNMICWARNPPVQTVHYYYKHNECLKTYVSEYTEMASVKNNLLSRKAIVLR